MSEISNETSTSRSQLDPSSSIPLYRQLANIIRESIESGEFRQDMQIPTESILSQQYVVSRITVRKALEELTDEGLLIRRQGKGTFVNTDESVQTNYPFMPFNEAVRQAGKNPGTKLVSYSLESSNRKVAKFLGLEAGSEIIQLKRLRFADSVPISMETDFFPPDFDFLASESLVGSSSEILRSHNILPLHGINTISICYANEEEANLLDVEQDAPLLYVYSEIRDQNQKPIQVSKQIIRSEYYKLIIQS